MARRFRRPPAARASPTRARRCSPSELLDAVTLERVTQGVDGHREGAHRQARREPRRALRLGASRTRRSSQRLIIEPRHGAVRARRAAGRAGQPAAPHACSSIRSRAIRSRPASPRSAAGWSKATACRPKCRRVAIPGATIRIEWLDDDGITWHPWQAPRVTNASRRFHRDGATRARAGPRDRHRTAETRRAALDATGT